MLKFLLNKLASYAIKNATDKQLLCRSNDLNFSVYKSGDDYILHWDDVKNDKEYEVTSFQRGETLFYIKNRSDRHERCWVKLDGQIVYHTREKTFELAGVDKLSHKPWGKEVAVKVWEKAHAIELNDQGFRTPLIAYFHKYYCGQGLDILTDAEAESMNLPGKGIGIFTVEDGCYLSRTIFYWTDKVSFLEEFSSLSDYGLSGADESHFYTCVRKTCMSLNNQILTLERVLEWLDNE